MVPLLLQVALIFLNAIFACAEIAVISINDARLAQLTASGNKKAKRLTKLTSQPAKFLATIQVAITLSGFLASAFAAENFSDKLVSWVIRLGLRANPELLDTVAVILITLILSYFTLVFGELVPKRIAMKKAEKMALALSGTVWFISRIFAPIVWFLTVSTNLLLRLFGIDPNEKDEEVTEEEIKMMVDAGSESGTIDETEKEIIKNVFEFDDLSAGDIAVHRTEIALLWLEESVEEWHKTISETKFSRYPICDGSVDKVCGILNAREYLVLEDKSRENVLENAVRPAYFVPESVKADVLFKNMKLKKESFAVVLDEYGGTAGIIAMKDIVKCIIGDIVSEAEPEEEPTSIEHLEDGSWNIVGNVLIEELAEVIGVDINDDESDTLSGYVLGLHGNIPNDGETFEVETDKFYIKALEIKEHIVERAQIILKSDESEKENDKEEDE